MHQLHEYHTRYQIKQFYKHTQKENNSFIEKKTSETNSWTSVSLKSLSVFPQTLGAYEYANSWESETDLEQKELQRLEMKQVPTEEGIGYFGFKEE